MSGNRQRGSRPSQLLFASLLLVPLSHVTADEKGSSLDMILSPRDAERIRNVLRKHGLQLDNLNINSLSPKALAAAVRQESDNLNSTTRYLKQKAILNRRMNRRLTRSSDGSLVGETAWRVGWFREKTADFHNTLTSGGQKDEAPSVNGMPTSLEPLPLSDHDVNDNSDLFRVTLKPPPGFEEIRYPYEAEVAVLWRGREVATTTIEVESTVFKFLHPDDVLTALGKTVSEDKRVLEALSRPLAYNTEKLCLGFNDLPDCGNVQTDSIAAILDLDAERVNLFVAESLLLSDAPAFLPEPESTGTMVLKHNTIASFSDTDDNSIYAAGGLLYSYGKGNLALDIDLSTETQQTRLLDMKLSHYFPDYQLVAGSYHYQPGGGSADQRMLGVTFFRSRATRQDRSHAYGTPLDVSLERPATVQLAIDDRIYSGQYLEAGIHRLNTSSLPVGSNDVEIRIRDASGVERIESVRFNKFAILPEPGTVETSFSVGTPLETDDSSLLPQPTGESLAGAAFAARLGENNRVTLGITQLDERSYIHSQWLHLTQWGHSQIAATADESGNMGVGAHLAWSNERVGLSLSGERTNSDFEGERSTARENLISDSSSRLSLSGNIALGDYLLGFRTQSENSSEEDRTHRSSAYLQRRWFQTRGMRTTAEARYQNIDGVDSLLLGIRVAQRQNRRAMGATATIEIDENGHSTPSGELSSGWVSSKTAPVDVHASAFGRFNEDTLSAGAQTTVAGREASAEAAIITTDDQKQRRHDGYASLGGSFAIGREAHALSGDRYATAGVVIRIDGKSGESGRDIQRVFDIFIDNSRRAEARSGQSTFLPLAPFRTYSLYVSSQADGVSRSVSNEVHEFTLYPGTVHDIILDITGRYVLIAQIVDEDGDAITLARTENLDEVAITDDSGVLQAEVSAGQEVKLLRSGDEPCQFEAPDNAGDDFMVLDAPFICLE